MREFKFRAWDKTAKRMFKVIELGIIRAYSVLSDGRASSNFEVHHIDCDIMQWTELQDKNGKDIYEGDILDTRYGIRKVEYNDTFGMFEPFGGGPNTPDAETETEIIGNIYENSDLIK